MARFYQQADWLMNESGDTKRIEAVKFMIGKHTRLNTCPARWNNQDATKVVPEALAAGVGLYDFTVPHTGGDIVPLDKFIFAIPRSFNTVFVALDFQHLRRVPDHCSGGLCCFVSWI